MSSVSLLPLRMRMGTGLSCLMVPHTSIPSIPGSIRSSTMRSNSDSRNRANASGPFEAVLTSNPARPNPLARTLARVGSSSTTRMRPSMLDHRQARDERLEGRSRSRVVVVHDPQ